jgi:hypothetical protein
VFYVAVTCTIFNREALGVPQGNVRHLPRSVLPALGLEGPPEKALDMAARAYFVALKGDITRGAIAARIMKNRTHWSFLGDRCVYICGHAFYKGTSVLAKLKPMSIVGPIITEENNGGE